MQMVVGLLGIGEFSHEPNKWYQSRKPALLGRRAAEAWWYFRVRLAPHRLCKWLVTVRFIGNWVPSSQQLAFRGEFSHEPNTLPLQQNSEVAVRVEKYTLYSNTPLHVKCQIETCALVQYFFMSLFKCAPGGILRPGCFDTILKSFPMEQNFEFVERVEGIITLTNCSMLTLLTLCKLIMPKKLLCYCFKISRGNLICKKQD